MLAYEQFLLEEELECELRELFSDELLDIALHGKNKTESKIARYILKERYDTNSMKIAEKEIEFVNELARQCLNELVEIGFVKVS